MNAEQGDIKTPFPYGCYIRQLFFSPLSSVVWNPKKFQEVHTIQQLEDFLKLDYIQCTRYVEFLEHCLQLTTYQEQDSSKSGENID